MNYIRHYDLLVERARTRLMEGYGENHHILPKCMGGSDDKYNLVKLTPEEHYTAHLLLVKIYPHETGLLYAVHLMGNLGNNKRYGWARRKHAEMLSETRSGINHPMYGKPGTMLGKKHTEAAKEKMKHPRSSTVNMKKPTGVDNPRYGQKHTEAAKEKMRAPKPNGFAQKESNSMYGKNHTKQSRDLMSEQAKKRKKEKCIHCGKEMMVSHIARYHNDKCKYKGIA